MPIDASAAAEAVRGITVPVVAQPPTPSPADVRLSAQAAEQYVIVGNALALPRMPQDGGWVATTCVTQTTLTADRRAARPAHNARRVAHRRAERRTRR